MTRAAKGDWWVSEAGAVYCVSGVSYGPNARGACVNLWWITGHVPPQVHRKHIYPRQWAYLTRTGTRLDEPPTLNHKGHDITAQVADVLGRLEDLCARRDAAYPGWRAKVKR